MRFGTNRVRNCFYNLFRTAPLMVDKTWLNFVNYQFKLSPLIYIRHFSKSFCLLFLFLFYGLRVCVCVCVDAYADTDTYIVYKAREPGKHRFFGLLGLLVLASFCLVCWGSLFWSPFFGLLGLLLWSADFGLLGT